MSSIDSPGSGFGAFMPFGAGMTMSVDLPFNATSFGDICSACGTIHTGSTACPPRPVMPQPSWNPPTVILPFVPAPTPTAFAFAVRISDEDVERIAKRVVELLKEAKP